MTPSRAGTTLPTHASRSPRGTHNVGVKARLTAWRARATTALAMPFRPAPT